MRDGRIGHNNVMLGWLIATGIIMLAVSAQVALGQWDNLSTVAKATYGILSLLSANVGYEWGSNQE